MKGGGNTKEAPTATSNPLFMRLGTGGAAFFHLYIMCNGSKRVLFMRTI
jgi:hypothetical protein